MSTAIQGSPSQHHEFKVLDCVEPISQHPYGYYRILIVPTSTIKYLRFRHIVSGLPDVQGVQLGFETVPTGAWNCAELEIAPGTTKYIISYCGSLTLSSGVRWHPKSIDCLSIGRPSSGYFDEEPMCHDKIYAAIYRYQSGLLNVQPQHSTTTVGDSSIINHGVFDKTRDSVFVHYTWWPSDMYGSSHESRIHYLIHRYQSSLRPNPPQTTKGHKVHHDMMKGCSSRKLNSSSGNNQNRGVTSSSNNDYSGIAPRFLGHLTENNSRIIGYVTEHITGRIAEPPDLEQCRSSLQKLHDMGIAYGNLSAEGFIVPNQQPHRGVILHSFGAAYETNDPRDFQYEMDRLEAALEMSALRRRREKRGIRI